MYKHLAAELTSATPVNCSVELTVSLGSLCAVLCPLSQGARALDGGKKAGKAATTQMQPSPNMKSTRKRYSQLGEVESSFDVDDDSSGFLLTNQGSGDQEPPCGESVADYKKEVLYSTAECQPSSCCW